MKHLYKAIDLCIKRFIINASSEYSLAPCWLVVPIGNKPSFVKAIAIPDSLYCLSNGFQDAYSITLKHTDIIDHLNKICEIKKSYALKFWTFTSRLVIKQKNLFPSLIITPTLHSEYFQLNLIDRNI